LIEFWVEGILGSRRLGFLGVGEVFGFIFDAFSLKKISLEFHRYLSMGK
jgi:hypothetical protein